MWKAKEKSSIFYSLWWPTLNSAYLLIYFVNEDTQWPPSENILNSL